MQKRLVLLRVTQQHAATNRKTANRPATGGNQTPLWPRSTLRAATAPPCRFACSGVCAVRAIKLPLPGPGEINLCARRLAGRTRHNC